MNRGLPGLWAGPFLFLTNMLDLSEKDSRLAGKILSGGRITRAEAERFYAFPLPVMGMLAVDAKRRHSGDYVFYNRNFHIEPTNVCLFRCKFCSYRRDAGAEGAWDKSTEEILAEVENRRLSGATEVHIVGGVHPVHDIYYYTDLIAKVKNIMPQAVIKAFTAVELRYMIEKAGLELAEGLTLLKNAGMEAIPGGGAEIFDEELRRQICPEKCTATEWLELHGEAHKLGITTNATILYGHIESIGHRLDHLDRLRRQQDQTGGFNAFIPLKYRAANNSMSEVGEVSIVEDMRMMALSRVYLDNIPHIKAYWPMFGRETARLALAYGADDMDGTIDDSTRIYSLAGAEEQSPVMDSHSMKDLILSAGFTPAERDTFYDIISL